MEKHYLGVDIGGTAVKLGVVDAFGHVGIMDEVSVSFDNYQTPIMDTVSGAIDRFLQKNDIEKAQLAGVGVSATGQVDSAKGLVAGTCGNLPGWSGTDIRARLEKQLALPVTVANDANCMCLGEVWAGAAKGYTDVIGVTIGTGVGGGILAGGKLLEGRRGLGGELGHFPIHAKDGVKCTCGNIGCWERYASTSALVRAAKTMDKTLENGRVIFEAAHQGRADVLALLAGWTDEIAAGLIGLTHIFNPQIILIGGGVSLQQELLIEPLRKKVMSGVMPAFAEGLELRAASLGNDAGLVGGVYYFRTQMGE